MREMLVEQQDVFYYVTLMNENYAQPDLPAEARDDVLRGCYRFATLSGDATARAACHAAGLRRDPHRGDQGGAAAGRRGHRRRGVQRHQLERAGARRRRPASSARWRGEAAGHALRRAAARPAQRPDRRRHRLRARRAGERARLPAAEAAATSRWAPTASAAATRARRCASSSASMRRASRGRRSTRSSRWSSPRGRHHSLSPWHSLPLLGRPQHPDFAALDPARDGRRAAGGRHRAARAAPAAVGGPDPGRRHRRRAPCRSCRPTLPVLVLPTQQVGYSPEHARFPGTLTLSSKRVIATWIELGECVARAGVRKLLLFNAHGGQVSVMDIVARELRSAQRPDRLQLQLVEPAAGRRGERPVQRARNTASACTAATSRPRMMLALRPQSVRMAQARDFPSTSQERAAAVPDPGQRPQRQAGLGHAGLQRRRAPPATPPPPPPKRARRCWRPPASSWPCCCRRSSQLPLSTAADAQLAPSYGTLRGGRHRAGPAAPDC